MKCRIQNSVAKTSMWFVVVAMFSLVQGAQAVVISFEVSEGFGGGDPSPISSTTGPIGVVDEWIHNEATTTFQIDHGPGGAGFGDEPAPVSGAQIALSIVDSSPTPNIVTIDLTNAGNYSLVSFWYANRGTFAPRLTVEYFGLDELSLGSDVYTAGVDGGVGVGLSAGFAPKFQLITPTSPFLGVALSKITLTSDTLGTLGHGSFALDDITLDTVPEPATLGLMGLGALMMVRRHK